MLKKMAKGGTKTDYSKPLVTNVKARVDHLRGKDQTNTIQAYDFGFKNEETDYAWKTKGGGAGRLLYSLYEKDRFELLKVNSKLPETLNWLSQQNVVAKTLEQDCTGHFSRMADIYRENNLKRRDRDPP